MAIAKLRSFHLQIAKLDDSFSQKMIIRVYIRVSVSVYECECVGVGTRVGSFYRS